MRIRTTTLAATLLLVTLTGCSGDSDPAPTETATATATSTAPALSKAEITQQCIDAVAAVISQRPADFDPEADTDPQPAECDALSETDYLDAYMDGLQQSNQDGRDALQRQIDEAAETDQP
ncbi:hypothetical protein AB0P17_36585 [Streptomyces sp. NPDC088124]|uniref:hypothetical protein n=1 Tax=Streptomyces sp. NPDC088124 TaxID=3154654 RepID=UPI00342DA51B